MANNGKDTNKSQFFVTLKSCQHLDLKHSIFGRVVGGLELLDVFNSWDIDGKDRPQKEIKLIRTEVFQNPFQQAREEAAKPKVEPKVADTVAMWFSNRADPMEKHANRNSSGVGKYLVLDSRVEKGLATNTEKDLPPEELEYAGVTQRTKKLRTSLDGSIF